MIIPKTIIPERVAIRKPNGDILAVVNEYEFNDILIQIKEQKAEGYYFEELQGQEVIKCLINSDGRVLNNNTKFKLLGEQLRKLI